MGAIRLPRMSGALLSLCGVFDSQENVLAGLLIDLSLLDQDMFRFRPGTVASAALLLARVTALFYSKVRLVRCC